MKSLFLLLVLCFLSQFAFAQVRTGTVPRNIHGPSREYRMEEIEPALLKAISRNSKSCSKSEKKFKDLIEFYNHITMKSLLDHKKDSCSLSEVKILAETKCLFKGDAGLYLKWLNNVDLEKFDGYYNFTLTNEHESQEMRKFFADIEKELNDKK